MDADNSSDHCSDIPSAEVLRFDLPSLLSHQPGTGIAGEYLWPIPPTGLLTLYQSSPEHSRAIQIKAEGAYGGGLIGDRAGQIDALADAGSADLFIGLGIDVEAYGNAFLQIIRSSRGIVGLRRLPAITMCRYRAGFMQRVVQPGAARDAVRRHRAARGLIMDSRYYKPRSITWWSGVALVVMGLIRGLADGFALGPVAVIIDAWTGGVGPSVLIAQGAGVIGLRAQL